MPCNHKFFGHQFHKHDHLGLFPNWEYKTLIIGTFNPENAWMPENEANYFYGRSSNYFWRTLPHFAVDSPLPNPDIASHDINSQHTFLVKNKIGITDLLVQIQDADTLNNQHRQWIKSVRDNDLEKFNEFVWNTENIKNEIRENNVQAVYFTKLGNSKIKNPRVNTFEHQIRLIEHFCNNNNIVCHRLHTPSGQGLRTGKRRNKLIQKWYLENGGQNFHFIHPSFDHLNYPFE